MSQRTYLPEKLLFDAICLIMHMSVSSSTNDKTFTNYDSLSLTKYRYNIWDTIDKTSMDDVIALVTTDVTKTSASFTTISNRIQNIVRIIRYFEILEPLLDDMRQTDEIYKLSIDYTITTDLNRYHVFIYTLYSKYAITYYNCRSTAFYTCAKFRLSLIPLFEHLMDSQLINLHDFCHNVYTANAPPPPTLPPSETLSKRALERLRKAAKT